MVTKIIFGELWQNHPTGLSNTLVSPSTSCSGGLYLVSAPRGHTREPEPAWSGFLPTFVRSGRVGIDGWRCREVWDQWILQETGFSVCFQLGASFVCYKRWANTRGQGSLFSAVKMKFVIHSRDLLTWGRVTRTRLRRNTRLGWTFLH